MLHLTLPPTPHTTPRLPLTQPPARCVWLSIWVLLARVWLCDCPLSATSMCVCLRACVCIGRGHSSCSLPLPSQLPFSLNTPGSRASTASAAAVLSSSSSSSRTRHHKSLSSSNHPCPSDLHAPRPRQVSNTLLVTDTHINMHTLAASSDHFSICRRLSSLLKKPDGQNGRKGTEKVISSFVCS